MPKIKLNDEQKLQALKQIFSEWKLNTPIAEHQFHPSRKFRFDFAWPLDRCAIEVEGGIYMKTRSGHSSITGIKRDIEKGNLAIMMGWRVIRCTPQDLFKNATLNMIKELLTKHK